MPGNRLTDRFWYDYRDKWVGDYICNGYYKYWGDTTYTRFENANLKLTVEKQNLTNLYFSSMTFGSFSASISAGGVNGG